MYEKQEWIDHIEDEHGNVVVEGTPFTKTRMEHIEDGIEEAHRIAEEITTESIGAAPLNHVHTPEDVGAYTYLVTLLANNWNNNTNYYEQHISLADLPEGAFVQGAIAGLAGTVSKIQIKEASRAILQLVSVTSEGMICIRAYGKLPVLDIPICIHTI